MTLATLIRPADFSTLVDEAFQPQAPEVLSAESDLGAPLQRFPNAQSVKDQVTRAADAGLHHYGFALWYADMGGRWLERRVTLDPPRHGHDFRHSVSGWGLIQLQVYFPREGALQCRISAGTQARARAQAARFPERGAVEDWNWAVVEARAFRLSRRLAAMGRTLPVAPPSPWAEAAERPA